MSQSELVQWETPGRSNLVAIFDAKIEASEAEIMALNLSIDGLNEARNHDEITESAHEIQVSALDRKARDLRLEQVFLRLHKGTMVSVWMSDLENGIAAARDDAYADALMEKVTIRPSGFPITLNTSRRTEDELDEFSLQTEKLYNLGKPENEKLIWCAITRQYISRTAATVAHIVPYSIGEPQACCLFGEPPDPETGHLMDPRNGLVLNSKLKQALDAAHIAIIPAEEDDRDPEDGFPGVDLSSVPTKNRFKVIVLHRDIYDELVGQACGDGPGAVTSKSNNLDGRLLGFKSDARPRKRYLYFTFVLGILRHRRFEAKGWQEDFLRFAGQKYWGTPGGYLRRSTMLALCRRISIEELFGPALLPLHGSTTITVQDENAADSSYVAHDDRVRRAFGDEYEAEDDDDDEDE